MIEVNTIACLVEARFGKVFWDEQVLVLETAWRSSFTKSTGLPKDVYLWYSASSFFVKVLHSSCSLNQTKALISRLVDVLNAAFPSPRIRLQIHYVYGYMVFCRVCRCNNRAGDCCPSVSEADAEKIAFTLEPLVQLRSALKVDFTGDKPSDSDALRTQILSKQKMPNLYGVYCAMAKYCCTFGAADTAVFGVLQCSILQLSETVNEETTMITQAMKDLCNPNVGVRRSRRWNPDDELSDNNRWNRADERLPSWLEWFMKVARVLVQREDRDKLLELRKRLIEHCREVTKAAEARVFSCADA